MIWKIIIYIFLLRELGQVGYTAAPSPVAYTGHRWAGHSFGLGLWGQPLCSLKYLPTGVIVGAECQLSSASDYVRLLLAVGISDFYETSAK